MNENFNLKQIIDGLRNENDKMKKRYETLQDSIEVRANQVDNIKDENEGLKI